MALEYVNISTLLVLVAESGYEFQDLVNAAGAVNDPFGDKDKWNLPKIIQNGTFKSSLLDQFSSLNADMVSISACNKNGEKLWTTHFNTTGLSLTFLDSLRGNNIIGSSAANNGTYSPSVNLSYNRYSTIIYPGEVLTDLAWFAVTNGNFIDDPHPMIFYARETSVPFRLPQIREGYEGCWPSTAVNVTLQLNGQTSGSDCASLCKSLNGSSVASISAKTKCNCGKYLQGATGRDDLSCYLTCDLRATQICGGFGDNWYSNYYVPGTAEYMTSSPELIYNQHFIVVGPDLQIDIRDLQPSTGDPAVVINISLTSDSESPYIIQYSDKPCGQEKLKQYPVTSDITVTYLSDGSLLNVGLLHVRCLQIHFVSLVLTADVSLFGPRGSYVKANALVVRAFWLGEGSTTAVSSPSATSSPLAGLATSSTPPVTASSAQVASSSSITPLLTSLATSSTPPITASSAPVASSSSITPLLTSIVSSTTASSAPAASISSLTPLLTDTPTSPVSASLITPLLTDTPTISVTSDSLITPSSTYTPTGSVSPSSVTPLSTYTPTASVASAASITSLSIDTATSVSDTVTSETTSSGTIPTNVGITTNLPAQSTYPSPSTTSNICFCDCRLIQHRSNLTDQELEAISVQIQRQLTVNKTELSSNIRKKTSASDSRTSAISIGIVGVALLVAVFGTIFVMDVPIILKDFVQLFRNLRDACSKSYKSFEK